MKSKKFWITALLAVITVVAFGFVLSACGPDPDTTPDVKDPPAAEDIEGADSPAEAAKEYFDEIWEGIPDDWQAGLLEMWSEQSGLEINDLGDIPEVMWTGMVSNWDRVSDAIDRINAGDSFADFEEEQNAPSGPSEPLENPVKEPPATVANGDEAKAYFEEIWSDIPSDWQTGILEQWSGLSQSNEGPAIDSLGDVPTQMWTMMAGMWSTVSSYIDAVNSGMSFEDAMAQGGGNASTSR
ncbi:MAG: hypothetical protein LBM77_10270 [Spirochaetaceae bacterium]|jgi:hypothetical protein|nr:hypothetical protein [Spirochaetaceae bacterium]